MPSASSLLVLMLLLGAPAPGAPPPPGKAAPAPKTAQPSRPAKASEKKPAPPPSGGSCAASAEATEPMQCNTRTVADLVKSVQEAEAAEEPEEEWKPAPLPFTWDVPRVLDIIPMSDVMEANGFPVKLSAVLSAERPEVILQHMVDRFAQAGLYLPPVEHQPQLLREPQLTALDPMGLISYTFILQPNPNKTTTVILGETNVGARRTPDSDVAPVMPGASAVLHSRQEAARTLAYTVGTPEEEVRAFYRKQLGGSGYQEREPGLYRKGTDELRVSVHSGEAGQTAVVIIRRTATGDEDTP
ncbi:MAG TPA: hypothetical protein VFZ09_08160 [Archangium sp.]|uniref:hypothetical protein n=1 Tax=Archangium sp. TaxID=1872627 RepID=UPI002E2FBCCA|nr:hypothetical protein [Archangium sp.]HEX5746203.1 hypothetical protein [Archangium sp.]